LKLKNIDISLTSDCFILYHKHRMERLFSKRLFRIGYQSVFNFLTMLVFVDTCFFLIKTYLKLKLKLRNNQIAKNPLIG